MSSKIRKYILKTLKSVKDYTKSNEYEGDDNIVPKSYYYKLKQYGTKVPAASIIIESYAQALQYDNIYKHVLNNLCTILLLAHNHIDVNDFDNIGTIISNIYVDVLFALVFCSSKNSFGVSSQMAQPNILETYTEIVLNNFIDTYDQSYDFPLTKKLCPNTCPILKTIQILNQDNNYNVEKMHVMNELNHQLMQYGGKNQFGNLSSSTSTSSWRVPTLVGGAKDNEILLNKVNKNPLEYSIDIGKSILKQIYSGIITDSNIDAIDFNKFKKGNDYSLVDKDGKIKQEILEELKKVDKKQWKVSLKIGNKDVDKLDKYINNIKTVINEYPSSKEDFLKLGIKLPVVKKFIPKPPQKVPDSNFELKSDVPETPKKKKIINPDDVPAGFGTDPRSQILATEYKERKEEIDTYLEPIQAAIQAAIKLAKENSDNSALQIADNIEIKYKEYEKNIRQGLGEFLLALRFTDRMIRSAVVPEIDKQAAKKKKK